MMPRDAAEPQDKHHKPAPIRKAQPQDQITPPLIVDGLETVRDPFC
jgi:hypothetical protein